MAGQVMVFIGCWANVVRQGECHRLLDFGLGELSVFLGRFLDLDYWRNFVGMFFHGWEAWGGRQE